MIHTDRQSPELGLPVLELGRLLSHVAWLVLPVALAPHRAEGQCTHHWASGLGLQGIDIYLNAMLNWDPDGAGPLPESLIAAGSGVAAWNGASWERWVAPAGEIYALATYAGQLIAAGSFPGSIARWTGSNWQTLGGGVHHSAAQERVFALVGFQGELIVGGVFNFAGGVPASNIARWDGASWRPLGAGVTGPNLGGVTALSVFDGSLIAGGGFTSVGGIPASRIARWNGVAWEAIGTGMDRSVNCLAVYRDELFAGGDFTMAGGVSANRIARWDGTAWARVGAGFNDMVETLVVRGDELLAGGWFTAIGIRTANRIARWNGNFWTSLGNGIDEDSATAQVTAIADYGGEMIVGGSFSMAGAIPTDNVARWNGADWNSMGVGFDWYVYALTVFRGELISGGGFTVAGGVQAAHIAAWNGDDWRPLGAGTDGTVYALAVFDDELIAAGGFHTAGGLPADHLARWDGESWTEFGAPFAGSISAFTTYAGDLVAGGAFSTIGGTSANSIARWDGSAWWALGTGITSPWSGISALCTYNGDLIAGGNFTAAGGFSTKDMARWDGISWHPMGSGMGEDSPFMDIQVAALTVYGGALYAGGNFSTAGGVPARCIARWNGTAWTSPGFGLSGASWISSFALYDGELIFAGGFSSVSGLTVNNIASWNGNSVRPLGTGLGLGAHDLTVFNGELIAGGQFTDAGGQLSGYWARWTPPFPDCNSNGTLDSCDVASGVAVDSDTNGIPDDCQSVPAAVTSAVSRGSCDLALVPGVASEPRQSGVEEVRIAFDAILGGPGANPVGIEEKLCPAPHLYQPYTGTSMRSVSVAENELVITFAPALENGRTYRINIGLDVTSLPGQFVEVRALLGDVNGDGRVDGTDRSLVIAAWTSPDGYTCITDLNSSGATNGNDRSIVIGGWTGTQNCAP